MNISLLMARKRRAGFIQAGAAWMLLCLAVGGALICKGLLLSRADHATAALSAQPVTAAAQWKHEAIVDVHVGQRVVTPQTQSGIAMETAVDPATWKLLNLVIDGPAKDGASWDVTQIQTLQSPQWIEENHAIPGALVPTPLDLREMGMEQEAARVVSIEPCPPIKSGPGRVVLTTVNHINQFLFDLTVVDATGQRETIGVTGWHKIYSESRGAWVSASTVTGGESLRARDGVVSVGSLSRRPGTFRVYNMTVEGEHVYYVSSLGTLVHNNCDGVHYLATDENAISKAAASGPITDPSRMLPASSKVRRPADIAVNPKAPGGLPWQGRIVGGTPAQNAALQADIQEALSMRARDIRVNQQQVDALGQRVGINRPDLSYTRPDGVRVHIEYDNVTPGTFPNTPRGPGHAARIISNDGKSIVILRSF